MNYDDAEAIRKMIDGHWSLRMNDETSDLWLSILVDKDAEIATRTVGRLARVMTHPPRAKDFEEIYAMMVGPVPPQVESCPTCGGDRFVPFAWRKAEYSKALEERKIPPTGAMIEEWAACPDCNANANLEYFRFDGSVFRVPDPSRVREMIGTIRRTAQKLIERPAWVVRWKRIRNIAYSTKEEAERAGVPHPVKGFQGKWRDLRPLPEQGDVLEPGQRPSQPMDDAEFWVQTDEYREDAPDDDADTASGTDE